jgi:hypothetical protein
MPNSGGGRCLFPSAGQGTAPMIQLIVDPSGSTCVCAVGVLPSMGCGGAVPVAVSDDCICPASVQSSEHDTCQSHPVPAAAVGPLCNGLSPMRQTSFFSSPIREHGGILSVHKRRSRRPMSTREAFHFTLRSEIATGPRSLLRHIDVVRSVMTGAERRFRVKVYRLAICGNHLHFLARGKLRLELQNFFRVLAGQIAQKILLRHPLSPTEIKQARANQSGCAKNRRKFWALLLYTRIVTWGREFHRVARDILQNTLEALNMMAYRPRHKARAGPH